MRLLVWETGINAPCSLGDGHQRDLRPLELWRGLLRQYNASTLSSHIIRSLPYDRLLSFFPTKIVCAFLNFPTRAPYTTYPTLFFILLPK
jgi:hypothetical protein